MFQESLVAAHGSVQRIIRFLHALRLSKAFLREWAGEKGHRRAHGSDAFGVGFCGNDSRRRSDDEAVASCPVLDSNDKIRGLGVRDLQRVASVCHDGGVVGGVASLRTG